MQISTINCKKFLCNLLRRAINIEFNEELLQEFPPPDLVPSDVFFDFEKYFNQANAFYDVTVTSHEKSIFAHKIILALRSPYFQQKFSDKSTMSL
jgi:Rps23 Pro-64 3,4-dihydroxylase Tpa1-like proline 4-hydroxylase